MTKRYSVAAPALCRINLLAFLLLPGAIPSTFAQTVAAPESPRLRALAAALDAGNSHSLEAFWKGIESSPPPLLESLPGHPEEVLFTFIWRADPDQTALNVQFNSWFPLHKTPGFDSFTRLGTTNLWYTSYLLPRNAHVRYELIAPKGWHAAPDRAAYFTSENVEYEAFRDPLNPRIVDWSDSIRSYAEGPTAQTSPYLRKQTGSAAGRLETVPIESKVSGNTRVLRVYLPPDYDRGRRSYGLLLVYDGNQYTGAVPTPAILDNMSAAGVIPPVVAVFLESPSRDVEFPPNDAFQRFVGAELLPLLHEHYRISRDPGRNAVLGSSYGGLAATYTAFMHPDVFGNVISQSGSYGWAPSPADPSRPPPRGVDPDSGWMIKRLAETPRKRIRFYLDAGLWEGNMMLFSNRLLRSVLAGKGYEVVYNETDGNHSSYYWMLRLPAGLAAGLGCRRILNMSPCVISSSGTTRVGMK